MNTAAIRLLAGSVLAATLSCPVRAWTQQPVPATPLAASGKEYVLTHKSSFNPGVAGERNPFWPIGWTPSAPTAKTDLLIPDVQASAFNVTSTSLDYPSLAVINGRTYAVGEKVPVPTHPGEVATVQQISDGAVVLNYRGTRLQAINTPGPKAIKGK